MEASMSEKQDDAIRDVLDIAAADGDPDTLIWVCRDIPGNHVGGPECFCCPLPFRPDEPTDDIMAQLEAAQRLN